MNTRITPLFASLVVASHVRAAAARAARAAARAAAPRDLHTVITAAFAAPVIPDDPMPVNDAPLPLDTATTRVLLTTTRRRVPSTRLLCVACATVATLTTRRAFSFGGHVRVMNTARHSARVITCGAACDACGALDLPHGARPRFVHDPPDVLTVPHVPRLP